MHNWYEAMSLELDALADETDSEGLALLDKVRDALYVTRLLDDTLDRVLDAVLQLRRRYPTRAGRAALDEALVAIYASRKVEP